MNDNVIISRSDLTAIMSFVYDSTRLSNSAALLERVERVRTGMSAAELIGSAMKAGDEVFLTEINRLQALLLSHREGRALDRRHSEVGCPAANVRGGSAARPRP